MGFYEEQLSSGKISQPQYEYLKKYWAPREPTYGQKTEGYGTAESKVVAGVQQTTVEGRPLGEVYVDASGESPVMKAEAQVQQQKISAAASKTEDEQRRIAQEMTKEAKEHDADAMVLTPYQAYHHGLISEHQYKEATSSGQVVETTQKDLQTAEEYKNRLKQDYPNANVIDRTTPYETYRALAQARHEQIEKIIRDPVVRTMYIFDRDIIGLGTVSEYAVSGLTGGDWEQKRHDMLYDYGVELLQRSKAPLTEQVGAVVMTGAKTTAAIVTAGAAAGAAGTGAKVAAQTGLKVAYGATLGTQYAETIKEPTAENVARSFVYSVPAMIGVAAKGVKVLRTPSYQAKVSAGTDQFKTATKGKTTIEAHRGTTQIKIYEKGLLSKLGLKQPKLVGTLKGYGVGQATIAGGQTLGKGQYVYAGTVKGQQVVVAGKEITGGTVKTTGNRIVTSSLKSVATSDVKIGKKLGTGTEVAKTKIVSTKQLEQISPKGKVQIWDTKSAAKGMQDVKVYVTKSRFLPEVRYELEGFQASTTGKSLVKIDTGGKSYKTISPRLTQTGKVISTDVPKSSFTFGTGSAAIAGKVAAIPTVQTQTAFIPTTKQRVTTAPQVKQDLLGATLVSQKTRTRTEVTPLPGLGVRSPQIKTGLFSGRSFYSPGTAFAPAATTQQQLQGQGSLQASMQSLGFRTASSRSPAFSTRTVSSNVPNVPVLRLPEVPTLKRGKGKKGKYGYYERTWPVVTGRQAVEFAKQLLGGSNAKEKKKKK